LSSFARHWEIVEICKNVRLCMSSEMFELHWLKGFTKVYFHVESSIQVYLNFIFFLILVSLCCVRSLSLTFISNVY
jgi:hypothetical protein